MNMQAIYDIDFAILDALQGIHNAFLNYFFAAFTYLGTGGVIWIALTVLMLAMKKSRQAGVTSVVALIVHIIVNEGIIKNIVKRPRPFTLHPYIDTIVAKPSSYSFPSGHTCSSFAVATVIFLYNKKWGIAAYIVAALIAFSRNYFYIHYPTDVLVGAVEGVLIGLLTTVLIKRHAAKKTTEGEDK